MNDYYIVTPTKEIYEKVVFAIRGKKHYHANWSTYKEKTAICLSDGCFGSIEYFISEGYKEMSVEDFFRSKVPILNVFN